MPAYVICACGVLVGDASKHEPYCPALLAAAAPDPEPEEAPGGN